MTRLLFLALSAYDHINPNPPETIGTRKLSGFELDQYCGGGPRGNLECCTQLFCLFLLLPPHDEHQDAVDTGQWCDGSFCA